MKNNKKKKKINNHIKLIKELIKLLKIRYKNYYISHIS